jgi:hypothetical protein
MTGRSSQAYLSGVPTLCFDRPARDVLRVRLQAGRLPSQAATGTTAGYVRYVALQVVASRCATASLGAV